MLAIIVIIFKLLDSELTLLWLFFIHTTNTIQHPLHAGPGAQTTSERGPALLKLEDKKRVIGPLGGSVG